MKLFLEHFRIMDDVQFYTDYKHLEHLEFNHSHPDLFMSRWREIVSKVDRSMIPPKMLLSIFLNKVRKFPGIQWDVEHFDRAPDGSPIKTYQFLVDAMDSCIDRDLRNRLMRQREHELKMFVSNRASALPSVENTAHPHHRNEIEVVKKEDQR